MDTKTTYILGRDVIGQHVTKGAETRGAVFLADGRGSTRGLYGPASEALLDAAQVSGGGAWTKVLNYDAYGNAVGFDPATAATEILYNGEAFNARTGQQYLRARWYNPSVGGFGRLDPWAGSVYRPATLNGYGYCHGDPVNYIDPSGRMGVTGYGLAQTLLMTSAISNTQAAGYHFASAYYWGVKASKTSVLGMPGSTQIDYNSWGMALSHAALGGFHMLMAGLSMKSLASGGGGSVGMRFAPTGGGAVAIELVAEISAKAVALAGAKGVAGVIGLLVAQAQSENAPTGGGGGGGESSKPTPSNKPLTRKWRRHTIAERPGGCDADAERINELFDGKAEIHTIVHKYGGRSKLGHYGNEYTNWNYHKVVVRGDRVYDAYTGSGGRSINEYKSLWALHGKGLINFGF